jgi:hypothetical protein
MGASRTGGANGAQPRGQTWATERAGPSCSGLISNGELATVTHSGASDEVVGLVVSQPLSRKGSSAEVAKSSVKGGGARGNSAMSL